MKKKSETITARYASGLYGYRIVMTPEASVAVRICEERKRFAESYGEQTLPGDDPVISIAGFLAWDNMEAALIHRLQLIARRFGSFPVLVNNYGGLPPHTIYLRVQDHEPFLRMAVYMESLAPYVKQESGLPIYRIPHIPLAEGLAPNIYERAMMDYSQREFAGAFEVSQFRLLRRNGEKEPFVQIGVFPLQSAIKEFN